MASRNDYYDILGIRRGASEEEVERAFRKLARRYQVDSGSKAAETRFKEISEAYEILSNKEKRERYDRIGPDLPFLDDSWEFEPEEEAGLFAGFEDVFGKFFGRPEEGAFRQPQRGKDVHCQVSIPFLKAIQGGAAQVRVKKKNLCLGCAGKGKDPEGEERTCSQCAGARQIQIGIPPVTFLRVCPLCSGMGKIPVKVCGSCFGKGWVTEEEIISLPIPPGINDGCRIYLKGMGEAGKNGGSPGDLVALIEVEKHPHFRRRGDDLVLEVPLAFWEATLGAEVPIPTLEGAETVKIPPGVQDGERLLLCGKGAPSFHGEKRGNQVMILRVVTPQDLDERSKALLQELKRRNPQNPRQGCQWTIEPHEKERQV